MCFRFDSEQQKWLVCEPLDAGHFTEEEIARIEYNMKSVENGKWTFYVISNENLTLFKGRVSIL